MDNQTDAVSGMRLAAVAGLICGACALYLPAASADIAFEDRGERFSLDVRDEPIADVMDELAKRFDFKVDGYPEHWSDEPMSLSVTGDLERVLRALLKDTSHVFEYHTNLDTNRTRITSLKLLNEGVEGFVANPPGAPSAEREDLTAADLPTDAAPSANRQNPANAPAVSGLSQSLASRARQTSSDSTLASAPGSNANPSAASSSTSSSASPSTSSGAPANNPATNVSEADMRALTQRALKDVQGLAEALRKAEGK